MHHSALIGKFIAGQEPLRDVRPSVGSSLAQFERVICVDLSYDWLTGKWQLHGAIKMMKLWVWKVRGVTEKAKHDGNRGSTEQQLFSNISWPAGVWSFKCFIELWVHYTLLSKCVISMLKNNTTFNHYMNCLSKDH